MTAHLSESMETALSGASLIRRMFELGNELAKKVGRENVFDFSIGNPIFDPPKEVHEALIKILQSGEKGMHRYMPNAGLPETRAYVAGKMKAKTALPYLADHIVMCVGAASGLNLVIKALCDPGTELMILKPYFAEYINYCANFGLKPVFVDTKENFQMDLGAIERSLTKNTRAIFINTPNNPTGAVYNETDLRKLGELLRVQSKKNGRPVYLVTDEPYSRITYDGVVVPEISPLYESTITVTSYSKDLAVPGERIGYVAVSPRCEGADKIVAALTTGLRILGYVNAPALMQKMLPLVGDAMVDMGAYTKNRDLLYNELTRVGFECVKPEGAFYLFPKSPIPDDMEFVQKAVSHNLLLVPGTGFGQPGYFRLSYCFETARIEKALPIFEKLI